MSVSRRTVAQGLAWAVPTALVVAPAPALAASPARCADPSNNKMATATWNAGTTTQSTASTTMTSAALKSAVTVSATSSTAKGASVFNQVTSDPASTSDKNFSVMAINGQDWLELGQRALNNTTGAQTVTITFPQPVRCVSFTVTDIDMMSGSYLDVISVSGGFVGSASDPNAVRCTTGTCQSIATGPTSASSTTGRATFTASGPLTSFTISYRSDIAGGATTASNWQQVWISPITFTTDQSCLC